METPSSNNSIYSSYILSVSKKIEDSELSMSKSRQIKSGQKQQDRCVLIDITNDSPIVGVASGGNLETPLSSSVAKQRASRVKSTPGSGEALLRGQVKTLLQKVEEEAELSKLSLESRPFLQFVTSPMALLAPTPVNTPQVPNLSGDGDSASVTPSPMVEEQLISQVVNYLFEGKSEENTESEKSVITRSLLMDFSEKSEISELTPTEDDVSSNWSIQVNAGTHDEDEEEIADTEEDYEDAEEEEEEGDMGMVEELCRGLNNVSVNERVDSKFTGKHTRFIYNSDDELVDEEEEEEEEERASASPNVLRLKGLPTPKGKHTRFPEEEEEDGEFMN